MSSVFEPRSVPGRRRRHPSNAARQAAYRKRVAAREAALSAAAGGKFSDAIARINALADERVAQAAADRDRLKAERDHFEREARTARGALRAATVRAEAAERRVARLELRLEESDLGGRGTSRLRAGTSSRAHRREPPLSNAADRDPRNRAQRRARKKHKGRRR